MMIFCKEVAKWNLSCSVSGRLKLHGEWYTPLWTRVLGQLKVVTTLKKQVGCFNHRVVALVAIMSGLCEVSLVLEI